MALALPGLPKIGDFTKATKDASKGADLFSRGLTRIVHDFKRTTGAADQAKNGLNQGRNAMGQFTAAGSGLGALPPQVAAIGTAMAAVTIAVVATVGAIAALAGIAIEVTQQRSKLEATFAALGGGKAAGKATLEMVESLATKLPFATEQIADWAKSLSAAGFKGKALQTAVESVAAATAIMGESGGAAAKKMLETLAEGGAGATKMVASIEKGGAKSNKILKEMGLSTADVQAQLKAMGVKGKASADQMGMAIEKALAAKGAGPLAEMGMTIPVIAMKLKEGFLSLFEQLGPAVKPFMASVQGLFGQFGRGTPVMQSLGKVVTQAFTTIFKYATMAVGAVSKWVQKNVTAKNLASVWKTVTGAIGTVIGVLKKVWAVLGPIFKSPMFLKGIVGVFKLIAAVVVVAIGAWAALTAALGAFFGLAANIWGVLSGVVGAIYDFVASLDVGSSAAGQFIAGLVDGIVSGTGAFVSAISSLAGAGLAAFKAVLGIHSPSSVMAEMGGHVGGGLEKGVDASAAGVGDSAAKLGAAAAGGVAGGASARGGAGKAGAGGPVTVHITVNGAGKSWQEVTEEAVALVFERLALSQGLT